MVHVLHAERSYMEMITVSAKTVDEAITKALIELGTTSDNIEYTVIEKGSSGILGLFGTKQAVIQAKRKKEPEDEFDLLSSEKSEVQLNETQKKNESVKKNEVSGETENKELPSAKKSIDIRIPEAEAVKFLQNMFQAMNMKVEIETSYEESERELSINMVGADMGILIGKRGQTLDSLQYLVSLVVNKSSEGYLRVKLDTENYRERRKETLETLARNIAYKVKRTKRAVSLEPMNPYERRIIHAALQGDRYVVTRSDGEEPFRHVVISLKRENNKRDRYHHNQEE